MKAIKVQNLLQVVCRDLQEKLAALAKYPRYAYERE